MLWCSLCISWIYPSLIANANVNSVSFLASAKLLAFAELSPTVAYSQQASTCSEFTIKAPQHRYWRYYDVFKKRLQHRCFSVKFPNFLGTFFWTKHLWWLLLVWLLIKKDYLVVKWTISRYNFKSKHEKHTFQKKKTGSGIFVSNSDIVGFQKQPPEVLCWKRCC